MDRIQIRDVSFRYDPQEWILEEVTLNFNRSEFALIHGVSGGGKSTLLNIIGGLIQPTKGLIRWDESILFKDIEIDEIDKLRTGVLGIIFADYRLAPHLTALENIYLPATISKLSIEKKFIDSLIAEFFTEDERMKLRRPVHKLSDGQKERVAIIRGLALKPHFLLADEIFSRVTMELKKRLWNFVVKLCSDYKIGMILVSHDPFMIRQKGMFKQCIRVAGTVELEEAECQPKR